MKKVICFILLTSFFNIAFSQRPVAGIQQFPEGELPVIDGQIEQVWDDIQTITKKIILTE